MSPTSAGATHTDSGRTAGPPGRRRAGPKTGPATAPAMALALSAALAAVAPAVPAATPDLPPETRAVLVEAVEAAAALDFYNARCRSDDSGRHGDNLNKQLVGKLRLTVVTVEDEFFPERNYRTVQKRLVEDAAERLRQAGGCKGAKDAGLPETLNTRYRKAVEAIEALP